MGFLLALHFRFPWQTAQNGYPFDAHSIEPSEFWHWRSRDAVNAASFDASKPAPVRPNRSSKPRKGCNSTD